MTELSGRKDLGSPLFEIFQLDIKSWGDDTAFVDSAEQLHNDLVATVVVDQFELSDVAELLHKSQELDKHLRDWSEQDLRKRVN